MVEIFKKLPYEKNVLLTLGEKNEVVEKSTSNIPYVKSIKVNCLNIKDLLKYKTLVLLKDSLDNLNALVK